MLRNLFCIFIAGFWTIALFPFATAIAFFKGGSWSLYVVKRWWSPVLLWAGGARLEVEGRERIDTSKPTIFVSNHQSTIDIPVLFMALPIDFRFVSKRSLQYVPFMGWYMTLARFVFIDRSNHRAAVRSLEKAGEQIRGGISIVMFPEGTRSPDGRILPFKKGPFALAMKAGVNIVPVCIEGSGKLMPKNRWTITPGPIRVKLGFPIDPAVHNGNRESLVKAVRDAIIDLSLEMGGKGGDKSDAVAARGYDGIGRAET